MKVVILGSGKGTNAEAIMNAASENQLANVEIVGVFSDSQDATILKYARSHNILNAFLEPGKHEYKLLNEGEEKWIKTILKLKPDLIVLAGFMRILDSKFLSTFKNQVINLHPSLLPSFPGLNSIEKAFIKKVKITGCTVHWVDERVDEGEIIAQAPVRIMNGDDLSMVTQKVQAAEHMLLPWVIRDLDLGIIPFAE
jgi:phosphoribosylglycinamide formyltransferase-1